MLAAFRSPAHPPYGHLRVAHGAHEGRRAKRQQRGTPSLPGAPLTKRNEPVRPLRVWRDDARLR